MRAIGGGGGRLGNLAGLLRECRQVYSKGRARYRREQVFSGDRAVQATQVTSFGISRVRAG